MPKASTSWFNAARKHCSQCGKASTKADRPACKSCGSTTWNFEGVAASEHMFLAKAQANATSLAKMMNVMEDTDEDDNGLSHTHRPAFGETMSSETAVGDQRSVPYAHDSSDDDGCQGRVTQAWAERPKLQQDETERTLTAEKGHYGALLVSVRGAVKLIKGESKPWTGVNGDFERSAEICNHRAVYTHISMPFSMWWAKLSVCKDGKLDDELCWCVGKKDAVGTDAIVAYVESMGLGPEEAGKRPWSVYSYTSQSWEKQPGIEVVSLDRQEKKDLARGCRER